jgi:hypothetical protein
MSTRRKVFIESSSWFPDTGPALLRARKRAEEAARQTGTPLIEARDGKPVEVQPPKARRKRAKRR